MQNIAATTVVDPSPSFEQSKRRGREGNLVWLKRHLEELKAEDGAHGKAYLVLFGGKAQSHFRLRVAQGHIRHDMSPSHWSHVVFLRASGWTETGATWEISLEPKGGFGYPPEDNGLQNGHLKNYDSRNKFPNVAVLRLPVARQKMQDALRLFKKQRNALDAVELTLVWLGYAWGVGRAANPLFDGYGIPSAAMVEALASAAGFDLTPGLASRASCPEAIWQAAKWWHEWYAQGDRQPHRGFWHTEHFLGK